MQRPEPTHVWLVREGDPATIEGTLSLDGDNLTFLPQGGGRATLDIPMARIRKARRQRGSPILRLSYAEGDATRVLFAYFSKPPPLPSPTQSAPTSLLRPSRGLERSAAARTLRTANQYVKRDIDAWVRALRAAGANG